MSPDDAAAYSAPCGCRSLYRHDTQCPMTLAPAIQALPSALPAGVSVTVDAAGIAVLGLTLTSDEAFGLCRALYLAAEAERRRNA